MKVYLLAVLCLVGFATSFPTALPEQEDVADLQPELQKEEKKEEEIDEVLPYSFLVLLALPENHLSEADLAKLIELKQELDSKTSDDSNATGKQLNFPITLPPFITNISNSLGSYIPTFLLPNNWPIISSILNRPSRALFHPLQQ
ncbi:uncharacterized protein LOC112054544 isoform X2 [Bicyclus anynana]|uniref:Uncharacterized protein LOC112054544 isoform X2 n=1 Tax=Bicyclus anynana TaxID=110368 RepID=A0A6J1NZA6_BICAN|nr:uncharacterized protein LOC112054544 isoform X2 [Bicyclus anynana]